MNFYLVQPKKKCNFAALLIKRVSGFSAVGSAHVWGARGRWFESSNPDSRQRNGSLLVPLFCDYNLSFFCGYNL